MISTTYIRKHIVSLCYFFLLSMIVTNALADDGQNIPKLATIRKAAEQGDSRSQCLLGRMYLSGNSVPLDRQKGCTLLYLSAEQGNASAIDEYNKSCGTWKK